MRTIAQRWAFYEKVAVPETASTAQRQIMRHTFYGGAQAALALMGEITSPGISDAAGSAILEGLHDEMRRFVDEVSAGRA